MVGIEPRETAGTPLGEIARGCRRDSRSVSTRGKTGYYLFGCDPAWKTITDTLHETLEEAMEQAEFEYEGVGNTWNVV